MTDTFELKGNTVAKADEFFSQLIFLSFCFRRPLQEGRLTLLENYQN